MRALEIRWTLWALLPILSTSFSEAAAPTSCSEIDSTYEASVYAFSVNCNTVGGNPATYAYYSVGDTFASCIMRCDLDDVCIAVNYQHFTGDCDLIAAFTQEQPSSDYDLAVKAYVLSTPTTSTSLTTDVMSTTDSTTLQSTASTSETLSTSDYTPLPTTTSSSDEVFTSAFTSLPETTSSSDILSTADSTSLPLTTSSDEVSTSAFTSLPETTSSSDVLSTADFTSLPSTESPSLTATKSDFMSISSDYTSLFSSSSFTSLLSTETFTSESTLTLTTSDSFVSSSMYLSGSTTVEGVTASSLTSSVLTFLTLSTAAAVIESSTITSVSLSGSSTSESISVPPTTSTPEIITIIASNSLSTITTADSTISNTNTIISSDDVVIKTSETTLLTDVATATTITTACTTRATLTDTVTSVTYVTVDSSLSVVTTCVPVTLLYSPCGCEHETYPTVDMVTVTSPCSIYSSYGKVTTTLTVPRACETLTGDGQPAVQYPSGWISSQTYSGHGSYYLAQPTAGPQTNSVPGSKQPSQAVPVLRLEAVSVKGKVSLGGAEATDGQPKATEEPSSEAGPEGNYHPEATADQSIPAASQLTGSPQSSVHYEQVPGKVPNATETLSLSWTTRHGNHQASAPASKTGSTDEIAQSNVPSGSGAKGSTPITVSGASRPHCVVWAIVGLVLMFY